MTASFVGTPVLAAAASSNSMSVTSTWGAGQNRTAPHLLVAVISAFGPTSVTLGTAPAGWTLYATEPSGATTVTATYTKVATGADAAPVFTATTVGGAGSSALTCTLFECSSSDGFAPVIQASGVQMDTVSSSLSPSASGLGSGDVAIAFAALGSNGRNATATWNTPASWTLVVDQVSSLPSQVGIFQDTSPAAGTLSVTLSWTRATTQTSAQLLAIASPQIFSGSPTATLTLIGSVVGNAIRQGAPATTLTLGSSVTEHAVRKSTSTTSLMLGASATGKATRQGNPTAVVMLGASVVGVVLNPSFIPTFVFFYTGTPLQFEIDEVTPTSVLFSFLSVGFIVTIITPIGQTSDGNSNYLFTLQRYALPPTQPSLFDPVIPPP